MCVLLLQVQGSLLSVLFDPANSHLLRHDTAGRVFLDHDPAAFGLLLRHLREVRAAAGVTGQLHYLDFGALSV